MPFCLIPFAGLLVLGFVFLSLRQLFSGRWGDRSSELPVPPRAITGAWALPILGHTLMFFRHGVNIAYQFDQTQHEWKIFPKWFSRRLESVYSLFLYGRWTVVVQGPELVEKVLSSPDVEMSWGWTRRPNSTLVGEHCMLLLDDNEVNSLKKMLVSPMDQQTALQFAPAFGEIADEIIDHLIASKDESSRPASNKRKFFSSKKSVDGEEPEQKNQSILDFNLLRLYTLHLIEGPILALGASDDEERNDDETDNADKNLFSPDHKKVLRWVKRLKNGLMSLKMTFGKILTEWFQLWRFTHYGLALNAREKIDEIVSNVVSERSKIYAMDSCQSVSSDCSKKRRLSVENIMSSVNGAKRWTPAPRRSFYEKAISANSFHFSDDEMKSEEDLRAWPVCVPAESNQFIDIELILEQELEMPRVESDEHVSEDEKCSEDERLRRQQKRIIPLIDKLLTERDEFERPLPQAVVTEIITLLWVALDAGNAWTSLALHLLAVDSNACKEVKKELDSLEAIHGKENLFSEKVLGEMLTLDALIYESIRLCPPFCGGIRYLKKTLELNEVQLQIPCGSSVIFSQTTQENFDLSQAIGKRPQELGNEYPSNALFGFLPLMGLEVPLMVMQSKVMVIALLQRFVPTLEVKEKSQENKTENNDSDSDSESTLTDNEVTQDCIRHWFQKIPFPEPRHSIILNQVGQKSNDKLSKIL